MAKSSEAIISIRPVFAEAILSGRKSIELRRRIPSVDIGTRLWIYATRPTGAVVGSATIGCIIRSSPEKLWAQSSDQMGVNKEEYEAYFDGASQAIGLVLINILRSIPISIENLRSIRSGFHPPQVMAKLTDSEASSLRALSSAS